MNRNQKGHNICHLFKTNKQAKNPSPYFVEAKVDRALHFPSGGGQLLDMIEGEAEPGAVGTAVQGAGLGHEGELLHDGA